MIPFVGYGSLMSARGLGKALPLVRDVALVQIEAARVFAKPPQRGGCLAMDVVASEATLRARVVDAAEPAPALGFEAVILTVEHPERVARREGYPSECWERLERAAGDRGVPELLARVAREAGQDVVAYRAALHTLGGDYQTFDAVHYLPHPVATDRGPAVVFLAPEPGETGCSLPSAKAAIPGVGHRRLDTVFELDDRSYPGFDPATQLRYVEFCLLAGAHGLHVGDLLVAPLPDRARQLVDGWLADRAPLEAERAAFAALLGPNYAKRFAASLDKALERSGLR